MSRTPAPMPADAEVLTVEQVAKMLGLNRNTVYDYANAGKIPCRRLGRRLLFSRSAIVVWLNGNPGKR